MDPLAEKFSYQSPYVYAANSPVVFIDYMGMSAAQGESTFEDKFLEHIKDVGLMNIQGKVSRDDFSGGDGDDTGEPTQYEDEEGNLLFDTDDGSNDVVVVPNDKLDNFKDNIKSAGTKYPEGRGVYNSAGWNNFWRDEFGVSKITNPKIHKSPPSNIEKGGAVELYQNLTDERGAIDNFYKDPSFSAFMRVVRNRTINQFTNPLNYAPSPSPFKVKPKVNTVINSVVPTLNNISEED